MAGGKDVDQGLFEEAIAEVKRLEGLVVKVPEAAPEKFAGAALFDKRESAPIPVATFDKALDDALRVERKLGLAAGKAAPAAQPVAAQRAAAEEERRRAQGEELEKLQHKFAKLEEEAKAKEGAVRAKKEEAKEAAQAAAQPSRKAEAEEEEHALARPVAPTRAVSEEEQVRIMKDRLSRLMGKEAQRPAAGAPAQAAPRRLGPAPQPAAPRKTIFETMEERRPAEEAAAQARQRPAERFETKADKGALGELEKQMEEERKRRDELQTERASALKEEIAQKVSERKFEEEKRKKEDRLRKDIEKELEEGEGS